MDVTVCQVRDAANALLDALPLNAEDRGLRLAKAARILRRKQARNAASRDSHAKARRGKLLAVGFTAEDLRCCIPP